MRLTSQLNSSAIVVALAWWLQIGPVHGAQPAADQFFHQGAQHFLATNGMTQAKLAVTNGLKLYPNDEKLRKLWELLNQQQQNQDQQQDQEKKDQDQQKDQQSKDQQKQGDEKKDQQQKSEEEKKQEQQQKEQGGKQDKPEEKEGQQSKSQQGNEDEQKDRNAAQQGARAVQMTPQQAIQLLEALKGEEKAMPFRPILKTNRQDRVFKDW